jgi:hypothetical protein
MDIGALLVLGRVDILWIEKYTEEEIEDNPLE